MYFRNLVIFRLADGWTYSTDALDAALQRGRFLPCGALDRHSRGWVSPRDGHDELVFSVGRQQLIALGIEKKLLPAKVVRQQAAVKLAEVEAVQGYKAGRKQATEIREQVEAALLPTALPQRDAIRVWIDPVNRWLVVDSASGASADEVMEQLKACLDALPLSLTKTALAPQTAMTIWLDRGAPGKFTIDRDCELKAASEEQQTVRYMHHDLDSAEIRQHIAAGKHATRLALTWNERVSFVLTEHLQVKRVAFLDILKEEAEREAQCADDLFAANFALMSGELAAMLADLLAALGGEAA